MKALIVGAGSVGQVFGHHLARGGADVTFLVKDKYVDECRRGFTMYPLPRTQPVRFEGASVVTSPAGVWDQVYLTVPSTALKNRTWLAELAKATGDASVVVLQPGLDDRALIAEHVAEERIVDGMIQFLSYHAPVPGETRFTEPGMAYWFYPGKAGFSGPRASAVVASLRAGKLPAKRVKDAPSASAFPTAVLSAFIAALEAADWSFAAMRRNGGTKLASRAAREAMGVVARERRLRIPLAMRLAARPFALSAFLRIGPRIAPVDLETVTRVHFTKVSDQMHEGLAHYIALGRAGSLPVTALEQLAKRLGAG